MCGKGGCNRSPKGGPKGEEDALAFFVGLFSSLFKKKKKKICCLVIFISFLLLGIDVVILGGKQSRQERGWGVGLLGAGKSHTKAGSEAGEFQVPLLPQGQGQSTTGVAPPPPSQNPLFSGSPWVAPAGPATSVPGLPSPGPGLHSAGADTPLTRPAYKRNWAASPERHGEHTGTAFQPQSQAQPGPSGPTDTLPSQALWGHVWL